MSGWTRAPALAFVALAVLSGCSGAGKSQPGKEVSSFKVQPGQCVVPPTEVKAELSSVRVVACTARHTQEAYAAVDYVPTATAQATATYPGDDVLKKYADGVCAQRYEAYVGVAYADSSLFFTYLLPSPRSWQAGDRSVVCFVTTTGAALTRSVKGTRL